MISITSPSVVIETTSPSQSVACVADPSVASGLIIQPEHSLQNDPTVTVVTRERIKEHLIDRDSKSETSSLYKASQHRLEDHAGLKQPSPRPEHAIVECTDGTTSPPAGSTQTQATLPSVEEIIAHRLEHHSRREQPTPKPEHVITDCTDGTTSPPPSSVEAKVTFCGEG